MIIYLILEEGVKMVTEDGLDWVDKIDAFKKLVLMCKNMDYDPEGVINQLSNFYNGTEEIETWKQGIKGAFTRDQTIAMVKTKLFSILGDKITEINNQIDALDLRKYFTKHIEDYKSYVDLAINNIDIKELQRRKDLILRNSVSLEYFNKKATVVLTEKMVKFNHNKPIDLLICLQEILGLIGVNDLTDVKNKAEEIKKKLLETEYYVKYIGTPEYQTHTVKSSVKVLPTTTPDEALRALLATVKTDHNPEVTLSNLIISTIERTDGILNTVKNNVNELVDALNTIPNTCDYIKNILTKLLSEVVLAYLKQSAITLDEFNLRLKEGYEILDNFIELDKEAHAIAINTINTYTVNIKVLIEVYNIIQEVVLKGTLD